MMNVDPLQHPDEIQLEVVSQQQKKYSWVDL